MLVIESQMEALACMVDQGNRPALFAYPGDSNPSHLASFRPKALELLTGYQGHVRHTQHPPAWVTLRITEGADPFEKDPLQTRLLVEDLLGIFSVSRMQPSVSIQFLKVIVGGEAPKAFCNDFTCFGDPILVNK